MDLPEYIIQKRNESESYAILIYKLRSLGIFRNVTANDYGVDFEIELVRNNRVTGRILKVQVKSSKDLKVRQSDDVPTVGGIKQSTLYYWTELSYSTHVLLFAVELSSEKIYMTKPLFWQATQLLDGTKKTKTVECLPLMKNGTTSSNDIESAFLQRLAFAFAHSPNIRDQISVHVSALRSLKSFLQFYSDAFHYDAACPLHEPEIFRSLLEISSVLLFDSSEWASMLPKPDQNEWNKYEHWLAKSNCEAPLYYECWDLLKILVPELLKALNRLRDLVESGSYYWVNKNPTYLRLVIRHRIPADLSHNALQCVFQTFDQDWLKDDSFADLHIHRTLKLAQERKAKDSAQAPEID